MSILVWIYFLKQLCLKLSEGTSLAVWSRPNTSSCMNHNGFMRSFFLCLGCTAFGLVKNKKINNKNDQESTICNVCDGEIHRRASGWVDSLLPDCGLINSEVENNSWIKPCWWMTLSGGRGSWEYALWHKYFNYIFWPWRWFWDVAGTLWCWHKAADGYLLKWLLLVHVPLCLSREDLLSLNELFQQTQTVTLPQSHTDTCRHIWDLSVWL